VTRSLVLIAVLVASSAHANVWDDAIGQGKPERARQEAYDAAMRQADERALQASANNVSYKTTKLLLQLAIESYQAAAAARPAAAEPYYRIGTLLYSFYFDCDEVPRSVTSLLCSPTSFNRERAKQVIEAWDAFETRAPLDPRLSVGAFGETQILFKRAILHTKLATKTDLEAAAVDYEKIMARHDGSDASEQVLGNLAETYMMIGRMEDALETYRQAVRSGSDTSTWYGYAVALDRDESTRQALEIIRSLGRGQRDAFFAQVASGRTFFVPAGEKYYYFALADEAFGFDDSAIDNWTKYIASGAHPEFQPRAKAHLKALSGHKKRKPVPIDPPWPELFR
jgi:tetratricopeptide (TPR) repeat protein